MYSSLPALKGFCKYFWRVAPQKYWFVSFKNYIKCGRPIIKTNVELEIYQLMRSYNEWKRVGDLPILYSDAGKIADNLIKALTESLHNV